MKEKLNIKWLVIILVLIVSLSSLGIYGWAKYIKSIDGEAQAQIAKFSFKVNNSSVENKVIEIESTRLDSNQKVDRSQIAPDTYGIIPIEIDASGSDVSLIYNISIKFENKPQNLKFYTNYSDGVMSNEIKVVNDEIMIEKYISLADIETKQDRNLYWSWPYETGDYAEQIEYNDEIDSESMDREMEVSITVTEKQAVNKPTYLADVVNVGDYVDYDASSGGEYTYTTDSSLTGSTVESTFSSTSDETKNMKWRVLSVNRETGVVELMAAEPTENILSLNGKAGYRNAEDILTSIGELYGHGKGAVLGRSIVSDDIEQFSNYDKKTQINNQGYQYGTTERYSSGYFIKENGDEIDATNNNLTVEMTLTTYVYAPGYFNNQSGYNMIFRLSDNVNVAKQEYWVLKRGCYLAQDWCNFGLMYVRENGYLDFASLCASPGNTALKEKAIMPVVVLKSNVMTNIGNQNIEHDKDNPWDIIVN